MAKRIREGDLFKVPLDTSSFAVGIVLHSSRHFQGSMMVGFYRKLFEQSEPFEIRNLSGGFVDTPNYVAKRTVTQGLWPVVGHSEELLGESQIPKLRVAELLYYKDDVIRELSVAEYASYPVLLGQGNQSVVNKLRMKFGIDNE